MSSLYLHSGATLNCGLHVCPSKCHQLYDHLKMSCEFLLYSKCTKGHEQSWKCHAKYPAICSTCDKETKFAEKKKREAFALKAKRDAEQLAHAQKLAELESKISLERQTVRDVQLARERENAIGQKEKDLHDATSQAARALGASSAPTTQESVPTDASADGPQPPLTPLPHAELRQASAGETRPPATNSAGLLEQTSLRPFDAIGESPSQKEWQRQKSMEGAANDTIDSIMDMTGLEEVKAQVLRIKDKIDVAKRQNMSFKTERFNIVLLGNPGTGAVEIARKCITEIMYYSGKTTVARHYAKFLASVDVLPGNAFVETTGSRLANDGVPGIKKQIEEILNGGGGTIFVDEAYQLTSEHNFQGSQVLDFLLAEMENNIGTLVFIFAGYTKQMEKFFEHNPGLISRVPYSLQFTDYTDGELLSMLLKLVKAQFSGNMKYDGGDTGLYTRIAVRRLGRGRGRDGFGNARALHNMFARVRERQAERLRMDRRDGRQSDDFLLLKEDLIGPDPSKVMKDSAAWKKLQSLTGLATVKQSIRELYSLIETNYQRELQEKDPIHMSLNRVFLGSPGTGKTTVARLYDQILKDLGILSNGEGMSFRSAPPKYPTHDLTVVEKNPADFIGSFLGQSESNTKAILAATVGKVLIIDEASFGQSAEMTSTENLA